MIKHTISGERDLERPREGKLVGAANVKRRCSPQLRMKRGTGC